MTSCRPPSRRSRTTSSRPPGSTASGRSAMFRYITLPSIRPAADRRAHDDRHRARSRSSTSSRPSPAASSGPASSRTSSTRRPSAPTTRASAPRSPSCCSSSSSRSSSTTSASCAPRRPDDHDRRSHRSPPRRRRPAPSRRGRRRASGCRRPWASLAAVVLAVLWTLPTFGLAITSMRPQREARTTGWWTFFSDPQVTLDNYRTVFSAAGGNLGAYFLNSFVITIPAVLIPLSLAALAAYAFAWIDFKGRDLLFVAVFALQIVPIQVTLLPLLHALRQGGPRRHASGRSGSRTRSSRCRSRSSCCTTSCARSRASSSRPPAWTARGTSPILLRVLLPLLTPGARGLRHLPVPLGLERPARRADLRRRRTDVAPLTVGDRSTCPAPAAAPCTSSRPAPSSRSSCRSRSSSPLQRYFVRGLLAGGLKG